MTMRHCHFGLIGFLTMLAYTFALPATSQEESSIPKITPEQQLVYGKSGEADNFKIDTSMPDFPALALLGQDQSALTNVTTPEDLGSHIFNQFDEDGDLKLGFAMGGHPYWWFGGDDLSLSEYAGEPKPSPAVPGFDYNPISAWERKLARTNVSFGVIELTQGETVGGNTGFKTAIGISTEWLDSADPRFDTRLRKCMRDEMTNWYHRANLDAPKAIALRASLYALQQSAGFAEFATRNRIPIKRPTGNDDADMAIYAELTSRLARAGQEGRDYLLIAVQAYNEADKKSDYSDSYDEQLTDGIEACRKKGATVLQSKQSLRIGAAIAGRSENGRADDLEDDGAAIWVSYRHPFGEDSEGALSSFGMFLKYEAGANESFSGDKIPAAVMAEVPPGETPPETVLASYYGYRVGLNLNRIRDDFVISGALSYVDKNFDRDVFEDEDYLLATMTASLKVRDGVWVEASFGWADDAKFDAQEFAGVRLKVDWNRLGNM
jgi:hypothetical protein